jgi:NAD(P)H-hydrate epimerase
LSFSDLPELTSAQVKQVDGLAEARFGVSVEWLMEAAGWQVARFCDQPAAVLCGIGNNAGDGLAAARHLHRWGRLAAVCCVDATRLKGAAARELEALRRLGIEVSDEPALNGAAMVVDAIFGTGLTRPPQGRFAQWIAAINAAGLPVVAVDVPSGLDADSGVAYAPAVQASTTVTLGLPKAGLCKADGPRLAGEVWLADIGVPFEVYAELGLGVPDGLFSQSTAVKL